MTDPFNPEPTHDALLAELRHAWKQGEREAMAARAEFLSRRRRRPPLLLRLLTVVVLVMAAVFGVVAVMR
ncbi:MAG: hypothetical protein KGL39_53095 [Patescibacteria group bacterium]|nr:hypothetical protein [Patescibacteria group bacterium]